MKARDHTQSMLRWWQEAGVHRVDLAVRRHNGEMIWQYDRSLDAIPLSWARWENLRCADVYIRPARIYPWPMVFLDDLPVAAAARAVRRYDALVVHTSRKGGCHLWLSCTYALNEEARARAQRWLALRVGADPLSTSGEHLGRLAGLKNWKRGGTWVNVLDASLLGRAWVPRFAENDRSANPTSSSPRLNGVDNSPSGKEWGWICGLLEAGYDPQSAYQRLVGSARQRRGGDAERYARRTIERAVVHVNRA
jgi:hypothetical protein